MRVVARPRREVPGATLALLSPLFRYSRSRDAYILRVIGGRLGPVLVRRWTQPRRVRGTV